SAGNDVVKLSTSGEGISWTDEATTSANAWNAIAWSAELRTFAAVAFDDSSGGQVMVSSSHPGFVLVGAIVAWYKSLTGTRRLPLEFVECNGQNLDDPESPYDGQDIPDLNGATETGKQRFLRGST